MATVATNSTTVANAALVDPARPHAAATSSPTTLSAATAPPRRARPLATVSSPPPSPSAKPSRLRRLATRVLHPRSKHTKQQKQRKRTVSFNNVRPAAARDHRVADSESVLVPVPHLAAAAEPENRVDHDQEIMPATPSTISTSASMTTALTTVPPPAPGSAAALDDTVQSFRLLEALRTGDLATLKSLPAPLTLHADLRAKFGSPLHLAVAMAPLRVVDWMLATATPAQINAAHPFSGETPLHVAARAARLDVVERLLAVPCINDGVRDANGSRALDVARVDTVRQVLADAQAAFVATATARMHALARGDADSIAGTNSDDAPVRAASSAEVLPDVIGSDRDSVHSRADPTSVAALASASSATLLPAANNESINKPALLAALQQLFRDPRAAALLDINHRDPSSGATVLHEAARRGDAAMVKWLLTDRRADPLVRDRKGKFFYEISKDDHIKALFKEFVRSTPLTTAAPDQLPQHQGSLLKWTNYASGYKARWFVLEDGILSYYKHQDDVPNACRGSIHLKIASLWLDTSDHHRFDIIGKGSVRYHLRADHVVEAKRWVHVISQSKRLLQDQDKDARRRRQQSGAAVPASAVAPEAAVALEATPSTEALPVPDAADAVSLPSSGLPHAVSASDSLAPPTTGAPLPRNRSGSVASLGILDDDAPMPARETLTMTVHALHAQLDLQAAVIAGLVSAATSGANDADALAKTVTSTAPVLNMAAATLHNLVDDLARLADDRDRHWQRRFDAESERKTVYEEALANLAREYQTVEAEARDMADTLRRTQRHMMRQRTVTGMTITPARVAEQSAAAESSAAASVVAPESPDEEEQERAAAAEQVVATVLPEAVSAVAAPQDVGTPLDMDAGWLSPDEDEDTTEDDDDEFFDAVDEEDEAHVAALTASITSPAPAPAEPAVLEPATAAEETALVPSRPRSPSPARAPLPLISESLPGYEDETYSFVASLRDNLPVDHALLKNEVSLWSVLKNAIGKDLSRITLPVYFNEPISMLQRLCEEIEYSQLLDLAWKRDRSDERLLLVTAFAMSSYASTVGRAGKPFNPLLGETYEYVRKDRGFRYVSEQVSHHPPISACFCESDRYQFYGEVNVKNRFWGKSLEVMPQGVCHVVLKRGHVGEQDEHFTWRKVTTSVNNLIVGTLWLDNYGDLEMVNHATKEKVVLTFKPTGWRNKDRCVVEGKLFDAKGKATWSLWGTWDEKLCCKSLTGDGRTFSLSNPNAGAAAAAAMQQRAMSPSMTMAVPTSPTTEEDKSVSAAAPAGAKKSGNITLWRRFNSPISASNFHLTPFAMSLNQMTPTLAQHLCPTDSRLRPDQRAMEEGRYDDAAFEKNRLEEKQRAARKVREQSGAGHAQPRWFVRDYDPDSRDEYWRFTHEYWACRAKGEWPGVPDIF